MTPRVPLPRLAAGGLALLALLLFVLQSTTLAKFSALPPTLSFGGPLDYARQIRARVALGAYDALGLGLVLALALALLAAEVRRGQLSAFLAWGLATERRALALTALGSLVSVRYYFTPGLLNWGGDAAFHLTYAELAAATISRGELPIWTNAFGAGSPYLQFYGFLFYYLTGLVKLCCGEVNTAVKLVLASGHMASGLGMYCLVRSLSHSRRAGLVGGLAFVLCFWHVQQVVVMGRLPLGLFYGLLPWPFYCLERLRLAARPNGWVVLGGLSLGCLIFTHPGYALWAVLLLSLYLALRLAAAPGERRRWGARGLGLLAWGLCTGAYLWLPMWLDRGLTGLAGGMDLSSVPDPSWHHLLVWSNYRFWLLPLPSGQNHWHGGYLGLSLCLLTAAGMYLAARRFPRHQVTGALWPVGVCLGLVLLMVLGYRSPLVGQFPLFHTFNASRYLLFAAFFLALAAGLGALLLLRWRVGKRRWSGLYILMVLGMLVDLGPTTFQHPCMAAGNDPLGYAPSIYASIRRMGSAHVGQDQLPSYRVFWALGPTHPFLGLGWLYSQGRTPLAQGFQAAELPAAVECVDPFARYVAEVWSNASGPELPSLPEYDFVARYLGALNVRFLLYTRSDHALAWPGGDFPHAPVLASARA